MREQRTPHSLASLGSLALLARLAADALPVRRVEPPSAHRRGQPDSILQRLGGPIAVGEQESALMSELGAASSGCQVNFPCRPAPWPRRSSSTPA
jgi:hypothetical protein